MNTFIISNDFTGYRRIDLDAFVADHFDAAVGLMDDEIREDLHSRIAPCTEVEFLKAYLEAIGTEQAEQFLRNFGLKKI
jgi:hypothetical protein